ncbi:hypothetical protein GNI_122960 [Gregarina niphandrodes]|uniref:Uncharacterized protein n=1 Tax=Gregarina niphandrodes TaxID=110365 RepID=A0A023B2C2_GRENI|nr:hypothetical protein GNI_122960 [Gregarina niphandrodes]EZG52249.1 hypothetical protein GNI_122960 [Gregarina niphandrodes]|eukprot:XP_011131897.1 hypothetical protein GNI_122960 [Gregarina niphandrodes]
MRMRSPQPAQQVVAPQSLNPPYNPANSQPPMTETPMTEAPRALTAAAAQGVERTYSPAQAPYYHYYSGLPSQKMNSFAPRTATRLDKSGKSTAGVEGVRPATDSMCVSTLEVESQ